MRTIVIVGLAAGFACSDLVEELPAAHSCSQNSIELTATAAERPESDGSFEVSGTSRAPDGVTVRAIYVASVPVPITEFNFRAWSVHVPANRVAANTSQGVATLAVSAFTSTGCYSTTLSRRVSGSEEGGAGGSAGGGAGPGGAGGAPTSGGAPIGGESGAGAGGTSHDGGTSGSAGVGG